MTLVTNLSALSPSVVAPWQDRAGDIAAVGVASGFVWAAFRFLVGGVIANTVQDVRGMAVEIAEIKETQTAHIAKIDQLVVALISNR